MAGEEMVIFTRTFDMLDWQRDYSELGKERIGGRGIRRRLEQGPIDGASIRCIPNSLLCFRMN